MIAKEGSFVKVEYVGKLKDGTIFDESKNHGGPLEFVIGDKKLLPNFENSIIGMKQGEEKTITIESEKAYGPYRNELVQKVEKIKLPEDMNPEAGQLLRATQKDGSIIEVLVTEVGEKEITIDINHPLAGKDLIFEIKIVEVSDKASPEYDDSEDCDECDNCEECTKEETEDCCKKHNSENKDEKE